jgi:hypothetical protein
MNSTTLTATQGDYGTLAVLRFTFVDTDLAITSLAGYTVSFEAWQDPTHPIISGACVLDSGLQCHYVPLVNDFSSPGSYYWKCKINEAGSGLSALEGSLNILASPTT